MRILFAALLALLLTACTSPAEVVIQKVYVPQEIDQGLLTCKAWPPRPERVTISDLLLSLAEAKAAWVDCSFKLGEIRALVKKPPARPPPG